MNRPYDQEKERQLSLSHVLLIVLSIIISIVLVMVGQSQQKMLQKKETTIK